MNTLEILETKKCPKCRVTLYLDAYSTKRSGKVNSICDHCLAWLREYYRKKRCLHNKYLYLCVECKAWKNSIKTQNIDLKS